MKENIKRKLHVPNLIEGLTYMNHFLISTFPSSLVFGCTINLDHHAVNKHLTYIVQLQ